MTLRACAPPRAARDRFLTAGTPRPMRRPRTCDPWQHPHRPHAAWRAARAARCCPTPSPTP
eukprot:5841362-Prymnesium_polylepis.1